MAQSTQRRIIAKLPEILPFVVAYNYDRLDKKVAAYVRSVAARFTPSKRRTLAEAIADGSELWAVKKLLLRGEFAGWRRSVFGPRERTAENCMAVAKWLESKSEILRICQIGPTACYLLVRRSVTEEARQEAIRRALTREKITLAVAHEIIASFPRDGQTNGETRRIRLTGLLNRHMEHWYPTELSLFTDQLRDYADSLAMGKKNKAAAKAV